MKKTTDMTEGALLPKIIGFAVPMMLAGIVQNAFNAADLVIVSRFGQSGSMSAGAVGVNSTLIRIIVVLFMDISAGAGIVAARAIGEKDGKKISDAVHTAITLSAIFGITLAAVGVLGSGLFLKWMHTPEELLKLASLYLRIYFIGVPASFIYSFGSAILRASGDSKRPLVFITISGVMNVLLNLVFVALLKLDVPGVALASVISHYFSAFLVLSALMKREDACRLFIGKLRVKKYMVVPMVKAGALIGLTDVFSTFTNLAIQSKINTFGEGVVSGVSAANSIEAVTTPIPGVINTATYTVAAQNIGAKKYDRAKKSILLCALCAIVSGIVTGELTYRLSPYLLKLYINDAPGKIAYGIERLAYTGRWFFIGASQSCLTSGMRTVGMNKTPTLIGFFTYSVFRLLWLYTVFPKFGTPGALYLSIPVSNVLAFIVSIALLLLMWKSAVAKIERERGEPSADALKS